MMKTSIMASVEKLNDTRSLRKPRQWWADSVGRDLTKINTTLDINVELNREYLTEIVESDKDRMAHYKSEKKKEEDPCPWIGTLFIILCYDKVISTFAVLV